MRFSKHILLFSSIIFVLTSCTQPPKTDEHKKAIQHLLTEFLENVDSKEMHDRFWTEDLIYTSSAGSRFGKDQIMSGFDTNAESEENDAPSTTYGSENIDIRIYGEVAVLTFQLVGKTGAETSNYLNSGTLVQRNGEWKVINWQATKMIEEQ